jgi:hypothetical protein
MATELVFQFEIEFDQARLPQGLMERFESALREYLGSRGLGLFLGGFGGCKLTYGFVHRPSGDAGLADREVLEEWLRVQPITCKVALADPEPYASSDVNRKITTGRLFELDNLSAADRQSAAAWREQNAREMEQLMKTLPIWKNCQRDFEADYGALHDILIYGTTMEDWRKLYGVLRATYRLEYLVDTLPQPLPATAEEPYATRSTASPILRFSVGRIVVISHFFTADEIDFDFDPQDVNSQVELDELLGFLRLIGDTVNKKVAVAHEGDEQHPFLSYDPGLRRFQYHGHIG